jgi:L-alanine-DL-glutamate epimerase-like enolase superfamily enzyme
MRRVDSPAAVSAAEARLQETNDVLDHVVDSDTFEYSDGYVQLPDDPDLGVEVDEATLDRYHVDG